jgi:peptide-methionine (S)-S-oxide reductase
VEFDPTKTSYEKILEVYWATHNHCATPNSRQYMSAVFVANDSQKKIAVETRDRAAAKRKQRITTFILPLGEFYLAEGYHQKYMLRQRPDLLREMAQLYPNEKDFVNSSAATRINGYLGGHGTFAQLQEEIDGFGLSPQGRATLLNLVRLYGKK